MKLSGAETIDLKLPADACIARVTGGGRDAGCIVLDVRKLSLEEVFALGSLLEVRGGFNVRREPGRGKPKTLLVHAGRVPMEDEASTGG